jgi:hypothetical protein
VNGARVEGGIDSLCGGLGTLGGHFVCECVKSGDVVEEVEELFKKVFVVVVMVTAGFGVAAGERAD